MLMFLTSYFSVLCLAAVNSQPDRIAIPGSPNFPDSVWRNCEYGVALDRASRPIVCTPFNVPPRPNQCPVRSSCNAGPADQPGLCCVCE